LRDKHDKYLGRRFTIDPPEAEIQEMENYADLFAMIFISDLLEDHNRFLITT
jgi:hypothetical protein